MKMKSSALITALLGGAVWLSGCSKDALNNLSQDETRIYITDRDSSVNFSNYKTFSVSDSVAVIHDQQSNMELTASDSAYIVAVKKYMQQRGYVLVNRNQNPDIGINVSRVYSTTGVINYYDYSDYYGGYYDPYYWGYYDYGYYMPYAYDVYQITEGAMSVDMLDLKDASGNKTINFIWTGLIRGEGIFSAGNADSQVKALFDQSSYLKTGE
ncbi:MAG TPA: DUF4136 domain-containing protein [Chitinophagaceae bacterium]|nr:DUF4136 domain-containing protein [Chitinophagaceae bacterium]